MPGAVVNAGLADRVLPLDQVVPEILRRRAELKGADGCLAKPQSRRSIRRTTGFSRSTSIPSAGIVLEGDKHYLFESRLAPIVRQLGLGSINDLCALLQSSRQPEVGHQVVEAMTTNETYFFRDPAHYDAIRNVLLPRLKEERRDTRKLRFWSAASSTGQEAYSLAMLLMEEGLSDWNIQILGTDFSSQVVERARSGRVPADRGEPRSAGGPPGEVFSPFRHGLAVERSRAPNGPF